MTLFWKITNESLFPMFRNTFGVFFPLYSQPHNKFLSWYQKCSATTRGKLGLSNNLRRSRHMGEFKRLSRPGNRTCPFSPSGWKLLVQLLSNWISVMRESPILLKNHVGRINGKLARQIIPWHLFLSIFSSTAVIEKMPIISCSKTAHHIINFGEFYKDS